MKLVPRTSLLLVAILAGGLAGTTRAELVLPRPSPAASMSQTVGTTNLSIAYSRPGVKGRAIWGALVPYDSLWRTGANEPTSFTTSDTIMVGGKKLAAGKYSVVTVPKRGAWDVAFTQQKDLQGTSNYDAKQEVLRVSATPDTTQPDMEWMWFGFEDLTASSCSLVLRWQRLRLAVPIAVDVNGIVLAGARREVTTDQRDAWRTPFRAATWCFDNNVGLAEGAAWLEQSLAANKNHANLALKARWLAKDGKKKDAIAVGKEAIAAGKASKEPVNTSATEKLVAEWSGTK